MHFFSVKENTQILQFTEVVVVYNENCTTVDQWSKNSSQKTQLYLYVQWRTNYMFRPFPNWPSSGWTTMSEELYTCYKYRHQYSVSTEKGGGVSFTNTGRVVRPVLEIHVLTVSA